jgi:predicted nucleic acid-binding protein
MGSAPVNAVFDTNIIIDALNGVAAADIEYNRYARVLISRITWMEVLVGAQDDDTQLRDFLDTQFEIIPLDLTVAERAVQLRRTHHIRLPDAIIWATAQVQEAVLITRNTKDFHVDWEGIRVPYQLPLG